MDVSVSVITETIWITPDRNGHDLVNTAMARPGQEQDPRISSHLAPGSSEMFVFTIIHYANVKAAPGRIEPSLSKDANKIYTQYLNGDGEFGEYGNPILFGGNARAMFGVSKRPGHAIYFRTQHGVRPLESPYRTK